MNEHIGLGEDSETSDEDVSIRRHWNDWKIARVEFSHLENPHWDWVSGGVGVPAPRPFIHAYVWCTDVVGHIAHSCTHGEAPHRIKVVIVKKDNAQVIWDRLLSIVGPKPQ